MSGKEKRADWCDLSRSDYLKSFLNYKHFDMPVEIVSCPVSFSKADYATVFRNKDNRSFLTVFIMVISF